MATELQSEREIVRDLARQVAEYYYGEEQAYRLKLWTDVNSLRVPERPPVVAHPGCWEELLPRADCKCADPWLQDIEYRLRQTLYKQWIGDDSVIEPFWVITVMRLQGEHMWGLPIGYTKTDVPGGAWHYVHPIREERDIEKIVPPRYVYDEAATREALERTSELLADLFPVQMYTGNPTPGAWLHGYAMQLCGMEELLFAMMDRPEWVHRLMGILRDGTLGILDQYEQAGVLTLNDPGIMACDDLPLPDFDGVHVRQQDLWGRGESQEFQSVGPAQYEEFLLNYQKPILARSGLTYYGCCEDLTRKIPQVLGIPNLRKFVCSPWTDLGKLVAATGDRYCIEWRQKATDVVFMPEMGPIREHLQRGLEIARGVPLHVTLQELETLNGRPERLREWAAAAKEIGAEVG
ncbi:MAG TPA: hypothetical protein VGM19_13560 [Armatimonadota bacterium]|jgi:hypothetical protein